MRARLPIFTRAILAICAAAAAYVGHSLSYHSVAPDASHRAHLLETTGHGSNGRVTAVLLGLLIFALSGMVARRAARTGGARLKLSYKSVLIHLLSLQASGFIIMEVLERLHAGSSLSALGDPVILLGLAAQVVMALVGAMIVVLFVRLARLLRPTAAFPTAKSPDQSFAPRSSFTLCTSVVSLAWSVRGPPASYYS